MEHWSRTLTSLHLSSALLSWAAGVRDPRSAWETCPHAEWLVEVLVRGEADRATLVLCLIDCARAAGRRVPAASARRIERDLRLAEVWVEEFRVARLSGALPPNAREEWIELADDIRRRDAPTGPPDEWYAEMAARATLETALSFEPDQIVAAAKKAVRSAARGAPDLAARILARRWPMDERPPELHGSSPAVQIAWDWVVEEIPPRPATTVEILVAIGLRLQLQARLPQAGFRERWALASLTERVVTGPDPDRILQRVLDLL